MESGMFLNKKINQRDLLKFGFEKEGNEYSYVRELCDGQFFAKILITDNGAVSSRVIETESGEEYILYKIPQARGVFVGRIREELEEILREIAENCFERDVFMSIGAKEVIRYIWKKYEDEAEYLWEKFPKNAVWRRKDNKKWYAALLTVSGKKLGLEIEEAMEIIDLRAEPEEIEVLIDAKRYYPGYHMNKKHWFTIILDGSVSWEEVFEKIDKSYEIAGRKRR